MARGLPGKRLEAYRAGMIPTNFICSECFDLTMQRYYSFNENDSANENFFCQKWDFIHKPRSQRELAMGRWGDGTMGQLRCTIPLTRSGGLETKTEITGNHKLESISLKQVLSVWRFLTYKQACVANRLTDKAHLGYCFLYHFFVYSFGFLNTLLYYTSVSNN